MAKSNSGGTRSFLKGRVGADVYSVGKDAKGNRQQVVRSLAETVANPQTIDQMRGRMIMSTVMQAVSVLRPIIDHSFDGVPKGQPSISEFISRNYALIKADVSAHPNTGNKFGLNMYHEKGMKAGCYVVSVGSAILPSGITFLTDHGNCRIAVGENPTYGTLKQLWEMTPEEYLTLFTFACADQEDQKSDLQLRMARLSIKDNLTDSTVLTAANALDAFNIEGNYPLQASLEDGVLSLKIAYDADVEWYGVQMHIVTRKVNGSYIHSNCTIDYSLDPNYPADYSLATYPVGQKMFLNGGDI